MKLAEAEKASHNHPPPEERIQMLTEQRARFRREFYGHLTDLRRFARFEKDNGKLPTEPRAREAYEGAVEEHGGESREAREALDALNVVLAKESAERALDTISAALQGVTDELKALDPDAK